MHLASYIVNGLLLILILSISLFPIQIRSTNVSFQKDVLVPDSRHSTPANLLGAEIVQAFPDCDCPACDCLADIYPTAIEATEEMDADKLHMGQKIYRLISPLAGKLANPLYHVVMLCLTFICMFGAFVVSASITGEPINSNRGVIFVFGGLVGASGIIAGWRGRSFVRGFEEALGSCPVWLVAAFFLWRSNIRFFMVLMFVISSLLYLETYLN